MALARVRTVFLGVPGTPWYSNLYFHDDGATPIGTTATGWVSTFWTTLQAQMVSGLTWATDPEVPTFDETTGKITKVTAVAPASGATTAADQALPLATQLLIRLTTDGFVNGHRVRGRIFVPYLGENNSTSGLPISSLRTLATNAANALITSSTSTMAIWARPFTPTQEQIDNAPPGKVPTPRLGSKHTVRTATTWTQWAILRSRRD